MSKVYILTCYESPCFCGAYSTIDLAQKAASVAPNKVSVVALEIDTPMDVDFRSCLHLLWEKKSGKCFNCSGTGVVATTLDAAMNPDLFSNELVICKRCKGTGKPPTS